MELMEFTFSFSSSSEQQMQNLPLEAANNSEISSRKSSSTKKIDKKRKLSTAKLLVDSSSYTPRVRQEFTKLLVVKNSRKQLLGSKNRSTMKKLANYRLELAQGYLNAGGSLWLLTSLISLICFNELRVVHTWHFFNPPEGSGRLLSAVMAPHLDQLPVSIVGQSQLLMPVGSHQHQSQLHRQIIRDISEQPRASQQQPPVSPALLNSAGSDFMSGILSAASRQQDSLTSREGYSNLLKEQTSSDEQFKSAPSSASPPSRNTNDDSMYSQQVSSSTGTSDSNRSPNLSAAAGETEVEAAATTQDHPEASGAAAAGVSSALPALGKILEVASLAADRALNNSSSNNSQLNSSALAIVASEKLATVALQMLKPKRPTEQRAKQQLVNSEQQIINQHARLHLTGHSHQRLLPTKQRDNKLANSFLSSDGSSGSSDGRNWPLNSLFGNLKSGISSRSSIVKAALSDNKLARTLSTLGKSISGNKYVAGAAAASAIAALGLTMSKFLSPYLFAGGFSKLGEGSMMGSGSFVSPNRANAFSTFNPSLLDESSLQLDSASSVPSYTGGLVDPAFGGPVGMDSVTSGSSNLYHFLQPSPNAPSATDEQLYLKYKAKAPISSYSADTNGHFSDYYANVVAAGSNSPASGIFSSSSSSSSSGSYPQSLLSPPPPPPGYSGNQVNMQPFTAYGDNTAASTLEPQFALATGAGNSLIFPSRFKGPADYSNQYSTGGNRAGSNSAGSTSATFDIFSAQPSTTSVKHSPAPSGSTSRRSGTVALKLDDETRAKLTQLLREQQMLLNQRISYEAPNYEYSLPGAAQSYGGGQQGAFSLPLNQEGTSEMVAAAGELAESQAATPVQMEYQPSPVSYKTARMMNEKAFLDTSNRQGAAAAAAAATTSSSSAAPTLGTSKYAPVISAAGSKQPATGGRVAAQSVPKTISQPSYFILKPKTVKASQVAPNSSIMTLNELSDSAQRSSSSKWQQQQVSGKDSAAAAAASAASGTNSSRDIKQQLASSTSLSSGSSWRSLDSMETQSSIPQKQHARPSAASSKQANNNDDDSNNNNDNNNNNNNNSSSSSNSTASNAPASAKPADREASSQPGEQHVSVKAPLLSTTVDTYSGAGAAAGNSTNGSKVLLLQRNSRTPGDGSMLATVKTVSQSGVARQSSLPQAVKVVSNSFPELKNVASKNS